MKLKWLPTFELILTQRTMTVKRMTTMMTIVMNFTKNDQTFQVDTYLQFLYQHNNINNSFLYTVNAALHALLFTIKMIY